MQVFGNISYRVSLIDTRVRRQEDDALIIGCMAHVQPHARTQQEQLNKTVAQKMEIRVVASERSKLCPGQVLEIRYASPNGDHSGPYHQSLS